MPKKTTARPSVAQSRARLVRAVRTAKPDVLTVASADTGLDPADLDAGFELLIAMISQPGIDEAQIAEFEADGARAARSAIPGDKVLDAYLSLNWAIWEAAAATPRIPQPVILDLADRLMRGIDAAVAGLSRGFIGVEVELAAEHSARRRSVLEELLAAPRSTPEDRARIRNRAERHGLGADDSYRLILIAAPGYPEDQTDNAIDRLEQAIRMPVPHHRERPGIRLPVVLEWRGRALALTSATWDGDARMIAAIRREVQDEWLAVDSGLIKGIEAMADALGTMEYSMSIAISLGRRGWVGAPEDLALETAFLLDEPLTRAVIEQQLGPILADERMGEELIETLRVHLGARQNIRETARRLSLAPRTIAYRLERIETLLGTSLDGDTAVRVGAALVALDVSRQAGRD